jgi:hypothetical protein
MNNRIAVIQIIGNTVVMVAVCAASAAAQGLRIPEHVTPTTRQVISTQEGGVVECVTNTATGHVLSCKRWDAPNAGEPSKRTKEIERVQKGIDEIKEVLPGPAKVGADALNLLTEHVRQESLSMDRRMNAVEHYEATKDGYSPEAQELMRTETRRNIEDESQRAQRRRLQGPASEELAARSYDLIKDSASVVTDGGSDKAFEVGEEVWQHSQKGRSNGDRRTRRGYSFPAGPTLPDGTFYARDPDAYKLKLEKYRRRGQTPGVELKAGEDGQSRIPTLSEVPLRNVEGAASKTATEAFPGAQRRTGPPQ